MIDPDDSATSLSKLRGVPTLISFARCGSPIGDPNARAASVRSAHDAAKAAGANHVTVYDAACPQEAKGREPVHPKAVETAYSVINRYPNETPSEEIEEAHFLVDRSGYIRARFRTFAPDDGNAQKLAGLVAEFAREPLIEINLHSH